MTKKRLICVLLFIISAAISIYSYLLLAKQTQILEYIEEGDWANTFKSVVCLGQVEEVNDVEKIYDRLRRLAKGFYPSEESIEKEIEKAGSRVKMYVINIDHMTGKLVHEK